MLSERPPLVYVVVLAWNHKDDTRECLESFLRSDYGNARFVVVDNASSDGTVDMLRQDFPQVEVLEAATNLGIAGGYNLGLAHGLAHGAAYVLVCNNDLLIDVAMLSRLVEALSADPRRGMAMPKIYHYYGDRTRLWCPGAYWRRFPPAVKMIADVPDGPAYARLHPIEFAPSCCLLISRAALEKAGQFDTGYFFYFDDWDYSMRLRRAGFSIYFVPEARLWHKVSVSTQKSDKPSRWWRIMGQSTVRYYRRYTNLATLLTFAGWFAVRETITGKVGRVLPFLGGVAQALRAGREGQLG